MSIRFNSLLAHQLMLLHYLFSAFTVRFNLLSLQLLRRNTKNALTAVYVWILPQCCHCWSMLLDYLAISLLVYAKDTTILSVNTVNVFLYWHNQAKWCWCNDICGNRRPIIRTQLPFCFCTIRETMGNTPWVCRKSTSYWVTVDMIAQPLLFNLYYPVENGSPAGSSYVCWLGGRRAGGPAEIKAARALSSG